MARHVMTISSQYQSKWTFTDAIRELIANAIDAKTRGEAPDFSVRHDSKTDTLTITSPDVTLPLNVLLLGQSAAREDDNCIGQFGEGLTLALLVLARLNCKVKITNNNETWVPAIEFDDGFRSDVLVVHTRQLAKPRHAFIIEIPGVTTDMWELTIRPMFLVFDPPSTVIDAGYEGTLLLDKRFAGKVFVQGVRVRTNMHSMYGYAFTGKMLPMNRDRNIIDGSAISTAVNTLLSSISRPEVVKQLANAMLDQAQFFETQGDNAPDSTALRAQLVSEFKARWPNGLPCHSESHVNQARDSSFEPIRLPWSLACILRYAMQADEMCSVKRTSITKDVTLAAFDESRYNFDRLMQMWQNLTTVACGPDFKTVLDILERRAVRIVEFQSPEIAGLWSKREGVETIYLSYAAYNGDSAELLATLCHELCHTFGPDGSTQHYEYQLKLLANYAIYLQDTDLRK